MEQKRDELCAIYSDEHVLKNGGGSFFDKKEACEYSYIAGWDACKAELESEFETILRLLHDGMVDVAISVCEENMSYKIK